jgi:hypothetical protein
MYKDHLLLNIEREIQLLKQLAPLIEERDLQFRPIEKVRNTLELMQYLSTIGASMMRSFKEGPLSKEEWAKVREYRSSLTRGNFIERLDEQLKQIRDYFNEITEKDLLEKVVELPNKEQMPLGAAIMMAPMKWLTVYRKELFLYLKLNGRHDISTREAWSVLQA